MGSIYKQTDADFLAWAQNFSNLITLAPTTYGLTAGQASGYITPLSGYAAGLTAATDPITRTKAAILTKNSRRKGLESLTRSLVAIILSSNVTDAQKANLGIPIRKTPTRRPAPTISPGIDVIGRDGTQVEVRVHDSTPGPFRRTKPDGVTGATIMSFVGPVASTDPSAWKFEENTTRSTATVTFPSTLAAGTQVWITAFWYNPRGSGPGASPVGTVLAGGNVIRRAA